MSNLRRSTWPHSVPAPGTDLTQREIQVIASVARGLDNASIANELGLSLATIMTHMRRLMRRLGAANRAHAVAIAYDRGILRPPPQEPQ